MFFIPFFMTIKTRYNSAGKVAVYFITYVFPLMLLFVLQNYSSGLSVRKVMTFLIALVSYINLYEIGYIFNDGETIKTEIDPTKRLSDAQLAFYEKHKVLIYCERVVLSAVLNFVLLFFVSSKSAVLFSLMELFSCVIFFIYNSVRGKITQLFYFFLSAAKYSSICFCFSENLNISVIVAAIFMFPIVRTIEYKAHYGADSDVNLFFRKYIIRYDISKITSFRVWATLALLCISVAFRFSGVCNWIPVIVCLYMFLYRLALFIAVKCGAQFKGYLKR